MEEGIVLSYYCLLFVSANVFGRRRSVLLLNPAQLIQMLNIIQALIQRYLATISFSLCLCIAGPKSGKPRHTSERLAHLHCCQSIEIDGS